MFDHMAKNQYITLLVERRCRNVSGDRLNTRRVFSQIPDGLLGVVDSRVALCESSALAFHNDRPSSASELEDRFRPNVIAFQ